MANTGRVSPTQPADPTQPGVEMEKLNHTEKNTKNETETVPDGTYNEPPTTGEVYPSAAASLSAASSDASHDPYSHLPEEHAAILKRQVETPERQYPWWYLYTYATKLDMLIIAISGILSAAAGAAMPAMTIIFGGLQSTFADYLSLQTISLREFQQQTAGFVLYFVYLAVGTFFATYISTVGFIYTGEKITANLRQHYLESCLRQNIGFFDKVGAGEVAVKITSDANRIQDGISEKVGLLLSAIGTVLAGFIIGFTVSWKLTLIMSCVIVALLLNTAVWTILIVKYALPMASAAIGMSSMTQEVLAAIRVVIAFGSQARLVKKYDAHLKTAQKYGFKVKVAAGMMVAVVMGMMHLIYGLGFWQGSLFLTRREIGLQELITGLMAVMVGSLTIGTVGPYLQAFTEAVGTVSRLAIVIDRETPLDGTTKEVGEKPNSVQGQLRLENISHIYPSRPDVTVMDNVSLEIETGKTTALVGASGSGKSTIFGLIERFYDPIQGRIFLDNHDINTLNLRWLRHQIGMVGQEPVLLAGTVLENILHGLVGSDDEHANDEEKRVLVEKAAKSANAHEFISQLPEGYATDVGQRGLLLSGGQKQRIAIARAIVSNPKILLLDEATSALDTKSEGVVQAALDQVSQNRTTITIAHRLSTVRRAHKIVVMSQGRIVEQGSHEQLLDKKGAYYDLVSAQQLVSDDDKTDTKTSGNPQSESEPGSPRALSKTSNGDINFIPKDESSSGLSAPTLQDGGDNERGSQQGDADYSLWTLISFTARFSKPDAVLMFLAFGFSIICGLATPVQAVFFAKQLIVLSAVGAENISSSQIRNESNFWSLMFLMLGLVTLLTHALQAAALSSASESLTRRVRKQSLNHMLHQDLSFLDRSENSPTALTATLAVETSQLSSISGTTLGNITVALSTVVGGVALSLAIGWKLALVCLSVLPVLIVCAILRFYILYKYADRASRVYVQSAAFAAENIAAMKTVASLTLEGVVAKRYQSEVNMQRKQSFISVSKSAALYAASQAVIFLCLGLAFWYGSTLMATFEYDIFQFFVCLMSVIFGSQSAGSMLTFIPDLVKARNSAAYLKALFDRKPVVCSNDELSGQSLESLQGKFELRDVHFHYPTRPEKPVLQGLSITVEAGQYASIVGASGSGKSTIISLLERFYDPDSGRICIDGEDISRIPVEEFRHHLALVSQEPALFQGTIRENISLGSKGDEEVSEETLIEVCKDAAIYDFILSLPQGFDTDIGSAGALLSGGQKQRIAIARAMVRRPRVLLLDEATSALDSESEHTVQEALERAAKGRTTVSIAHRLSTIRKADVIHFIDQGRVAESGSHEELMALNGLYAELVKLQSFED